MGLLSFIVFFLILSFLVIIHELGHFFAAKKSGITVHEFGFGLPPKLWGKKYGETEYTINALPIGGFVRIEGEDASEGYDSKSLKSFVNKKPKIKLFVLMAGVTMNIILAVTLYYFYFIFNNFISNPLIKFTNYPFLMAKEVNIDTVISGIENKSLKNKLIEGDIVYNAKKTNCSQNCYINNLNESYFTKLNKSAVVNVISKNINIKDFQKFIGEQKQNSVELLVYNISSRQFKSVEVSPYFDEKLNRNIIGVFLGSVIYLDYGDSFLTKVLSSPVHSINIVGYSTSSFIKLISASFVTKDVSTLSAGVSGPIGIFSVVKGVLESKSPDIFWLIIDLTSLISLSLAFMNALPIPALDGGRAVFVLVEAVTKKKINPKYETAIHKVGMIFLLLLIALVTLKDFINLF